MKIEAPASAARRHEKTGWSLRAGVSAVLAIVALTGVMSYVIAVRYIAADPAARLWAWATERGHAAYGAETSLRAALVKVPQRLLGPAPALPKLVLDIKFKDMQEIQRKRTEALATGVLMQSAGDMVPAAIRHGDHTTRVKLRLKGDQTDHLSGEKWSFRIHVRGKDDIFGMRRFSIQHPKVRGYEGEALFYATLRREGVLAPRYLYADVTVNGKPLGIMAVEEHFSKEMLESSGRRESAIVRFDESYYWAEIAAQRTETGGVFDSFKNTSIDAFGSSRIADSEQLSTEFSVAVGLLRGFVAGQLRAAEVFDADLLGRFLAVAQLWGSWHSLRWHNQRFYLNPITLRLEPVGFDADIQNRKPPDTLVGQGNELLETMLDDPEVFAAYHGALRRLAAAVIDGTLPEFWRKTEQEHLPALQKEFFLLQPFPYGELERRARHLLALSAADLRRPPAPALDYPLLLNAYVLEDERGDYLELANAVPHELEIRAVEWVAKQGGNRAEFEPAAPLAYPVRLGATPRWSLPESRRIYFRPPADRERYSLQVTANISGQPTAVTVKAVPYAAPLRRHPIPVSSVEQQLSQHPFLSANREARSMAVRPGTWRVDGTLIVPPGYSLTLAGGTTLRFPPDGGIIAHGALNFSGADGKGIVLQGSGDEDGGGPWQGVVALNAAHPSQWRYVTVLNTTGIDRPGWRLTGGVTFYRSPVTMEHCRLAGNRGEDALNIVHSDFTLTDIEIADTASDGFDSDFSRGTVQGGLFQQIGKAGGGDGVDISGSDVKVDGTRFLDISDKALSVGEQSRMAATRVVIERAGTGAASKDGSWLELTDSQIGEVRYAGLMAYVKKSEFGPGQIAARNVAFSGAAPRARVQTRSTVTIDGAPVAGEDVDVGELYQTVMKKGLQR